LENVPTTKIVRLKTVRLLVALAILFVLPVGSGMADTGEGALTVISDSPFDDSTDAAKERIVVLEYLLTLGHPDALEAFEATDDELTVARRRLDWYSVDEAVYSVADKLLGDEFGGIWIGFDGTINVAYTSDKPREQDFPAEVRKNLPITFHLREHNSDSAKSEAENREAIYDITTGEFIARDGVEIPDVKPALSHNNANTMPGMSLAGRCEDDGGGGTAGFRVTWRNSYNVRRYGFLVNGHWFEDTCSNNGVDGKVGRRTISDNNIDVQQNYGGDWISSNKQGRGIYDISDHELDAGVVRCETNACGTRENNIHLAATPKHSGGGDDDDWPSWDNHDEEVQDVDQVISVNDTLCLTAARVNGVVCGWYGGVHENNGRIMDFANGYPGPGDPTGSGDSGGPVYTILDSDGPRAVGIHASSYRLQPFDIYQWGIFYRVDTAMLQITTEFDSINELEVCGEAADGSWDYDCD